MKYVGSEMRNSIGKNSLVKNRIDHKMMPPHSDEQFNFNTLFK